MARLAGPAFSMTVKGKAAHWKDGPKQHNQCNIWLTAEKLLLLCIVYGFDKMAHLHECGLSLRHSLSLS